MSKKAVTSMAQLEEELKKMILASMNTIAIEAEKELKDSVQKLVYDAYTPKYYKRTGELKKSISRDVYQVGSFTTAKIYHDISKMRQHAPTQNYRMGTHYSTVKSYFPQEYAYFVPVTIDEGTSGEIFGKGAWTEPRRYFSTFVDKMSTVFSEKLRSQLIRKGLTIRRV